MTDYEARLNEALSGGEWRVPNISTLADAIDDLIESLRKFQEADGWTGVARQAADEQQSLFVAEFKKLTRSLRSVETVVKAANSDLVHAGEEMDNLPSTLIPKSVVNAVSKAAKEGLDEIIPFKGSPAIKVDEAIDTVAGWLTGNRDKKAEEIHTQLEVDLEQRRKRLAELRGDVLESVSALDEGRATGGDLANDLPSYIPPSPQPIRLPRTNPNPGSGGGKGGIDEVLVGVPGEFELEWCDGFPPYIGDPDGPRDGDHPDNPRPPKDDPDPKPGPLPKPGGDDGQFPDGKPGGLGTGLAAAGGLGGAFALRAVSQGRFGASAMGGTGLGASGLGARGAGMGAGGSASGGLLGSANAGSRGGAGAGAAGNGQSGRGGLLGGQGGAGSDEKKRRANAHGIVAPELEEDEEFVPLPESAGSGGRDELDI